MGALRGTNRGTELLDDKVEELITSLHLRALSEGERIPYVDAQIAYGALDLCVAEQDLHSAQVPCLPIYDGRLGSAQRTGSVIFRAYTPHRFVVVFTTGASERRSRYSLGVASRPADAGPTGSPADGVKCQLSR